ncbi:MAG: lipopolysaccharide biosynthesis protein [Pseudomonadota bacterium]
MTESEQSSQRQPSLRSQTARGVAWMMLFKLAVRSLSLVSTLILVRLLAPQDFGLVAMAMVFIAIMDTFSWFSFDVVLIQNQDAGRDEYDTAWTFNVIFKTVSAIVLLLAAYPAALYYDESRVTALVMILGGAQFLSGFENIGVVNFRKRMEFDKEFRFMFLCKLAGFLVTVPLAFLLRNYWALIAGQVANKVVAVTLSYTMDAYRPRFSLKAWRGLFNFSKWLMIGNICGAIRLRATELIIGRLSGAKALGFFNVSLELSNTPTTELIAPINRAVFPAYARISDNLASLRSGYLKVIAVIALIAMPAGMGIAATAPLLVPVALGEQWLPTIPLFVVLAFNGVLNAMQTNIGSVFLALGRPKVLAMLQALNLTAVVASVIPATQRAGIEGAALAFLGATLLLTPLTFLLLFREIQLRLREFLAVLWRAMVGAAVMYGATVWMTQTLITRAHGETTLTGLAVAVLFGAVLYTTIVACLWIFSGKPDGAESFVLESVTARLKRRRGGHSGG